MNSSTECQLFDVKQEVDLDNSVIKIKSEPEDVSIEPKIEAVEYDVKDEKQPICDSIPIVYIKSEVIDTQTFDECLENYESKSEVEQQNKEQIETTVYDHSISCEEDFHKEKCVVHNHTGEKSDANTLNKSSSFENGDETNSKRFKCDTCFKTFSQKCNLTQHQRTHTNVKPYKCVHCCRSFSRKHHLTDHARSHTNEKPFKCDICYKSFSRKQHVTNHARCHTNEKLYICSICGKSLSYKFSLAEHERTHTGKKPLRFKCDTCSKAFSQKCNLTQHQRTHTNEKPYKCGICCKSFSRKHHLIEHSRSHTNEKPFKCDICYKSFSRKQNVLKHTRCHANENLHM